MGLFDYVTCHMPLPEPAPPPGTEFQTKDLGEMMERYTITADGYLIHHPYTLDKGERVTLPEVEYPFHGDVEIYASRGPECWDYWLRFTAGRCTKVWRPPPYDPDEPRSDIERLQALRDAPPR